MTGFAGLGEGLSNLLQWTVIAAVVGGSLIGMIVGAIPGLGAAVGMSLMLPIIFFWPPMIGLVLLSALWMADNYGGSISAIFLGIPGTAGAIFTVLDGHPMAQQGKGKVAIGVSLISSAVGGITGALLFLLVAPPIVTLATAFGSAEYFLLAMLGLTAVSVATRGNLVKALLAACLGFLLALVGVDIITGYPRFVFNVPYLIDSFGILVVILGIFAVAPMLELGAQYTKILRAAKVEGSISQGMRLALRYPITLIRSSGIGAIIGALPGTGIMVATPLAYQQTVSMSKHPETFGTGDPEGIVAPESANNAVQGGGLIPTLTLGIPGSISSAVFLGGLMVYGIVPGPKLFATQGPLVWTIWWSMLAAIVCFLIFGPLFNRVFVKVTEVPFKFLMPIIFALVIGGVLTVSYNVLDIVAMLGFGILGYFMRRHNYPAVPFILGFILGPMAEEEFFRSLLISRGSYGIFFDGIINPILLSLIALALAIYFYREWKARKRKDVD